MRKLAIITILCAFVGVALALSACKDSSIPETVTIDDVTYQNGFYGVLWPHNLSYEGDETIVGEHEFYHVANAQFDWVHGDIGHNDCGVLYCAEDQWEQARSYYADGENYTYYCHIAKERGGFAADLVTLTEVNTGMFFTLINYANAHEYDILEPNRGVETQIIPAPDKEESPTLIFYAESNDGLFTSFKGNTFLAIDGKLWLVWKNYHEDGEIKEIEAVEVPDEIGQYFIELFEQIYHPQE